MNAKLEILDKELNNKEEEIVMVMSLYKEVLALKEQVRYLRERGASSASIRMQRSNGNGFNTSGTAAGLLSKLLRQIQHFQTHYKKN